MNPPGEAEQSASASPELPPLAPSRLPSVLRALTHRNYRLFITGQLLSLVGYWMQQIALQWLIYSMTSNSFLLGLYGFSAQLPVLILGLYAGLVVDQCNRHRLIIVTQFLAMLQAFALFALTVMSGPDGQPFIRYWQILSLGIFGGILQSFDLPARQAFLIQMVPRRDLGNAIALNSLGFNSARIVGPAIAGLLIASMGTYAFLGKATGEAICFAINAVTYLVVISQLFRIKPLPQPPSETTGSNRADIAAALRYAFDQPHIGGLLIFVGGIAVFGLPYLVLLPVFAKDVFGGDSTTLGTLVTCVGIGALMGGLGMARRKRVLGLGRVVATSLICFSISISVFAWLPNSRQGCIVLVLAGASMVSTMIGCTTLVQTLVADRFRGRILSFYMMMNLGMMPFGSLLTGWQASSYGPRVAMTTNAFVCTLIALAFLWRLPVLRRSAHATPEYAMAAGLAG